MQNKRSYNRKLETAIREIGNENFSYEIIEEIFADDETTLISLLDKKEKYWIEWFDSVNYGYNDSIGGSGKSFLSNNEKFKIFKLYIEDKMTIKDISKITGHCIDVISDLLRKVDIDTNINKKLNDKEYKKKINQIDKNTFKVINTFDSLYDAARFLVGDDKNKIVIAVSNISKCANKKIKTSNGYIWEFVN